MKVAARVAGGVVLVAGVVLVLVFGFIRIQTPADKLFEARNSPTPCTTPPREGELIAHYASEPALYTPPDPHAGASVPEMHTRRFCDDIGVDSFDLALFTEVGAIYEPSARFSSARLRSRYDPVVRAGGWSYERQADAEHDDCGFAVRYVPGRAGHGSAWAMVSSIAGSSTGSSHSWRSTTTPTAATPWRWTWTRGGISPPAHHPLPRARRCDQIAHRGREARRPSVVARQSDVDARRDVNPAEGLPLTRFRNLEGGVRRSTRPTRPPRTCADVGVAPASRHGATREAAATSSAGCPRPLSGTAEARDEVYVLGLREHSDDGPAQSP